MMKFLWYIVIFVFPLLKVQGQSQLLKGTIKAKKDYSYTYLPASTETKTPEVKKAVEDFFPPLQYTLPPNNNFKALTFEWGSFIAAKNQPIILEPQPIIDSTTLKNNLPKKEGVLDPLEPENNLSNIGVLDPLDPITNNSSQQVLTPTTIASNAQKNVNNTISNNTVLTPATPASSNVIPEKTTLSANNGSILLTPTKPAVSSTQTNNSIATQTTLANTNSKDKVVENNFNTNPVVPVNQPTNTNNIAVINQLPKTDFKVYLDEYGKYNIVFAKDGASVTITQFGRVNNVVIPTGSSGKPTYNYRGLLESVGGLQLQYTYEGRVLSVGGTTLTYNYNGNVETINGIIMLYNANGSIHKFGNAKILYDYTGKVSNIEAANAMIVMKQ
ncbi:MAG: hypothetical protein ACOVNY_00335 [Chitinophagaceae bacterium]